MITLDNWVTRVGADPRVCPNNNEQPACSNIPNSWADTGVCPYRSIQPAILTGRGNHNY